LGAAAFGPANALDAIAFLAFVLLGAILVLRRPQHPVGWLFAALGLTQITEQAAQEYALWSLAAPGGRWGGTLAVWATHWTIAPGLTVFVALLLLFPNGRPPSPRWRWLVWSVAIAGLLLTVGWAVGSWPLRLEPALSSERPDGGLFAALRVVTVALVVCLPVAAGSLVWRFRTATGEERQQLKWLALAAVGLLVAVSAGLVAAALGTDSLILDVIGSASIAGIAFAAGLAVLRYRLYEIDRIISRTLGYGLLTVLLACVYALSVMVAGAALEPLAPDSSAAVAVSTLAVVALFAPLRRRTQATVARRFHRSQYDAQVAVAAFRARVRAEVRRDALAADLQATVARTVQPAHVSVWLRPGVTATPTHGGAT
jgi:hypothetical protein